MTFESFNLQDCIARRVKELGYITPTPIQEKAIPKALEGRDIMGLAQTGTGKTAAFVLPILQRLLPKPRRTARVLVIAPTRELAEQISEEFRSLGSGTRMRCTSIYGGVSQRPQVDKLRNGTDIVVACPGRLLDLINQGVVDLSRIEVLVLDEADRMFDMGFLPDIRRIAKHVPQGGQVMLFSATMPKEIRALARDFTNKPVTIEIGHSAPVETVSHALYPVKQHLKTDLLMELLHDTDTGSVLIFTKTKHRAKRLDRQLTRAGYNATSIQGNLSQKKRQAAMDGFKDGTFQIMVATDIAARGIDVNNISHVINFDIPDTADAYTHRIGRTGRAAKSGDAFTMITPADEGIVRAIERVIGSKVERRTVEGFNYNIAPVARSSDSRQPSRQGGRNQGGVRRKNPGRPGGNQSSRPAQHSRPKGRGGPKARYGKVVRNRA